MSGANQLTDEIRQTIAKIADFLIPEYGEKPAASDVGVHKEILDKVFSVRPDLVPDFMRGVHFVDGKDISEAMNALCVEDRRAFDAITNVVSGGYLLSERVREVIGYPGQEPAPYDPYETPEYMTNGMLARVARRGSIYRPTPSVEAQKEE
ncbi:hypothetical protein TUMSATVNIG1_21620 [Vibrio nigripulchritudo]|uniref:hypothetical protein n=1 Tax=Vibrio nigripulchritudo TaxID=28173 RepID=UPI00190B62A0|nr:hypothetical protein [Vibrio nigripulchritudo]BCL70203.1 hypothetical protein VNTUMSATTG_21400 [Vibrio nigripulchritudo]BDU31553.1 hypothetical protein TUMSATVNIG1_21620 [Vibrio nigripulchritudo]